MSTNLDRRTFLKRAPLLAALATSSQFPVLATDSTSQGTDFNVRNFGAKGDGQARDTAAVQRAIDAAGQDGGCVSFPPGRYLCGTVRLRSHVTLHLGSGATIVAAPDRSDFDDYEKLGYDSFSDMETTDFNFALIRGRGVEHVAILGPGRIDMARKKRGGPKPIALKLCRNILVRDLTIENAPNYNISLIGCDFVDIIGVTIRNGYCDGIDPDSCRFVRIANCFIESWDDAIVPKASPSLGYLRATEHVTVTNCVLTTACNALKLGTESSGGFKDIVFSNCSVYSSTDLWPGRRATSGVSLEMVDGGAIERVAVSNITMRDVRAPIFVRLANRGRAQKRAVPLHLRDVSISDIVATDAILASSITGIPGFPVNALTLRNIRVTTRGHDNPELATRLVPEREGEYPDAGRFGDLPAYGLFCRHVDGLVLDGINLSYTDAEKRPAVILDDISNFDLRMLLAKPASGEQPVIRCQNVKDGFIQGCRALAGTGIWGTIKGPDTGRIHLAANDLAQAAMQLEISSDVPQAGVQTDPSFTR
jgi:hypothetical protein